MPLYKKRPNPAVQLAAVLVVAGALLLTGCGPRRVRADYTNYENSFAVTSNREVLLNLARLKEHDPTYFLSWARSPRAIAWRPR